MTTDEKLDWIIETLKRMEGRQVALKTEVDDVQVHEPEPVGSYGTVDAGKKA
jgi:dsDNA-specific endonuclease/ATPase MutS2